MSEHQKGIPWQAWMIVTLLCSGISAWGVIEASKHSGPGSVSNITVTGQAGQDSKAISSAVGKELPEDPNLLDPPTSESTVRDNQRAESFQARELPSSTDVPTTKEIPPFFMTRRVTEADLVGKGKWEIYRMRNEIFARYGRRFNNEDLQAYFDRKSWYEPRYLSDEFPNNSLTRTQKENAAFMLKYEEGL